MLYVRIEEWEITAWKDGCVFKTKFKQDWFIPMSRPMPPDTKLSRFASTSDRQCYRLTSIPPELVWNPTP